jgi:hypothetical protein
MPHVGDIGTVIRLTVTDSGIPVNLSSATSKRILLKGPDGISVAYNAVFTTDGSDGVIEYTTSTVHDLRVAGAWEAGAKVSVSGGTWNTDPFSFTVKDNL